MDQIPNQQTCCGTIGGQTEDWITMMYFKKVFTKLGIMAELLTFFWEKKLWWLIPMILMLLCFSLLIVLTQGTAVAPFIYTLF